MESLCFSSLIVLCLIGCISGAHDQTNELSQHKSSIPASDSQKLETDTGNGTFNEDIAKILETYAKNNLKSIGVILVKIIGDYLRKNPKTQKFAGAAEIAAGAIANSLADHVSKRVYEVTKNIRPDDLKNGGIGDLKQIVIRAMLSSKEPLKVEIARAIEKKAAELKEKTKEWHKILGDITQDKIAKIPGIDKELSEAIRKVIESASENLANEVLQKLESPEKDKIIGGFVDRAYNGIAALWRKASAIARAAENLQNLLDKDFAESETTHNPFL